MADLVNTPQLAFPFRISGRDVAVVEQDTATDREQNAEVVIRYTIGERTAVPDFGIPDQAMRERGVDPQEIASHIAIWEPDVETEIVESLIENGLQGATIDLDGGEE